MLLPKAIHQQSVPVKAYQPVECRTHMGNQFFKVLSRLFYAGCENDSLLAPIPGLNEIVGLERSDHTKNGKSGPKGTSVVPCD